MSSLRRLTVRFCMALQSLPDSLCMLPSLQELMLSGCMALATLPNCLSRLTRLQLLNLEACDALTLAPETLDALTGLRELILGSAEHTVTMMTAVTGQQDILIRGPDALNVLPDFMQGLKLCLQKPGWRLSAKYNAYRWRLQAMRGTPVTTMMSVGAIIEEAMSSRV